MKTDTSSGDIAKFSVLLKLFKRIVTQQLSFAIKTYISPLQRGLRERIFTLTNLLGL